MLKEHLFATEYGKVFLGDSFGANGGLPDESINLVVTSPPFALTRKKAYGNKEDHEYVGGSCLSQRNQANPQRRWQLLFLI